MKLLQVTFLIFIFSFFVFGQEYQRSFHIQDRFKEEIKVTEKILNALTKDIQVKNCLEYSKENSLKKNWFRATNINLNNDGLEDVIVEPTRAGNCRTAMRPPYWILLNKGKNYELVLTANTFFLYINREKMNNHFNITIDWSTANTHYKTTYGFDGRKYIEIAESTKPNN